MRDAQSARERILEAAESRLLSHGPTGLVLDAVAADAGVSKGGLLYHFPSKDALVDGLTERMLEGFDRAQAELRAADPEPRGAWARAYLRSTVDENGAPAENSARLMAGILAGIGGDSARLAAVRDRFEAWQRRLEERDDIDPLSATLVRLISDGLWLGALLGLPQMDKDLVRDVLTATLDLTHAQ